MKWQWLQFPAAIFSFVVLWLCIRFPYEVAGIGKKLLAGPDHIDPLGLHLSGEFVESNLGTAVDSDGALTVRLIAQQFLFVPHCVTVPAGRPVRFRLTSADVVHRFTIAPTDHAIEVVPGHVNQSEIQFNTPGEYTAPCHEFCGAGHYDMRSRVVVVAPEQFPQLMPEQRLTCAAP
jgi:cytochrome c oxidase subunit II